MKIKLDENLPVRLATTLKNLGHEVHPVHEEGLKGSWCAPRNPAYTSPLAEPQSFA